MIELYHTKYYYRKEVCYKIKKVPYIHKELIRNKYSYKYSYGTSITYVEKRFIYVKEVLLKQTACHTGWNYNHNCLLYRNRIHIQHMSHVDREELGSKSYFLISLSCTTLSIIIERKFAINARKYHIFTRKYYSYGTSITRVMGSWYYLCGEKVYLCKRSIIETNGVP